MTEMLKRFSMMDYKPMTTPMIAKLKRPRSSKSSSIDSTRYRKLIGLLMYLVNTQPNIYFALNVLNQFQVGPNHHHWIIAKNILRHL